MNSFLKTLCVSAALVVGSTSAHAFTVNFWDVDQGGGNGIPGTTTQTPGNPGNNQVNNLADALAIIGFRDADATFTSSGIDYPQGGGANSTSNNGLLSAFLGTDWGSLVNNAASLRTVDATTVNNASVFEFKGGISLGAGANNISIASDDGFLLEIGGVEVGRFDGTRAIGTPSNFVYNAAGGVETFRLVFFEDQNVQVGVSATLNGNVITHTPIPLPAAGFLMIGALGGLAAFGRRKKAA